MDSSSTISLSLLLLLLCLSGFDFVHTAKPKKIGQGYRLVSLSELPDGALLGELLVNKPNNVYGPDIPHLQLYVKHETEKSLRVHITDAEKQRWEVPYELLPREKPPSLKQSLGAGSLRKRPVPAFGVSEEYSGSELLFSFSASPFGFAVRRKSNGETLFNSSSDRSDPYGSLVFKDQYLEMSTRLAGAASLYGLGESTKPHGIRLHPNDPFTLYTTDQSAINLNMDLYGSHPMYMDLRNADGVARAHAVLLLNSNGMDLSYTGTSLTYRVIGGVLDFYFFSGPSPLDVVDQYTAFIGRPAAMPYWSFGFHQCRWGYHNLSVLEDVVDNYEKAKIPLDVIWNDDDHMDGKKIFTLNPGNYPRPQMLAFLSKIHAQGMKYIVIVDPGIGVNKSYGVYQRGIANDVFIKYKGEPYVAQVWPGAVNFPDFLNPKTVQWWVDEIHRFHELLPVDGLWLDMNEVSNFCTGLCTLPEGRICPNGTGPGWICCLDCKNVTKTRWDDPPYKINASGIEAPIGYKTIATSAEHHNGVLEYDAHSIYGFSQTVATHRGLQSLESKRPFILTRSTFVGSGHYAAHWTGDNKATWEDLKYSISTMLEFGMYGVPMVGADICGFYPPPTEELCNRWIQLGAFYPFSRDHANYYSPRQELYQWETVAESGRNALGMRYRLLPYLYTLNYEAHTTGAPIARPLFFTFPMFTELYGLSTQFLLGKSIMISPVLEPGKTEVNAMFPPGTWYDMFNMTQAIVVEEQTQEVVLDAPLNAINVHLYQNAIVPMQRGGLRTKDARDTPFTLVVAFPFGATASKDEVYALGTLFLDEDELPEMKLGNGQSTLVSFCATAGGGTVNVSSEVQEGDYALGKGWIIERVTVLGVDPMREEFRLQVDGAEVVDTSKVRFSAVEHANYGEAVEEEYDEGGKKKNVMLEISGLELLVGKNFCMSWKVGITN